MAHKTPKGEISISKHRGSRIRLRWRVNGQRYELPANAYTHENLKLAAEVAGQIRKDILAGAFDASLAKYERLLQPSPHFRDHLVTLGDLSHLYTGWVKTVRSADPAVTVYYLSVAKFLQANAASRITTLPELLSVQRWSTSTYNDRLSCLRNFLNWLTRRRQLDENPLGDVQRRRRRKIKSPRRKPLTVPELQQLLAAIRSDRFCPAVSGYRHSHYYPFLLFLAITGVRPAEAIGLRTEHLDFARGTIWIGEVMARSPRGTHSRARVRKETKTGTERYLAMTPLLQQLLIRQIAGKAPGDLVFPSPRGLCIDDRMLQRRVVRPVMQQLGIEARDLYSNRHGFGTRAVEQGIPLTAVAEMMGNSVETAARNYIHLTKKPGIHPVIEGIMPD